MQIDDFHGFVSPLVMRFMPATFSLMEYFPTHR
jgi:hypothetical protein